jgi:predicted P-loop ATPase
LFKEKDLADWARDQRQVQRAWDRALEGSDSDGLMRSKSGEPFNNLSNAISMLRADEEFPLSFDLMQSLPLVAGEHLTDIHVTRLTEHLQRKGLRQISESNVHSAINAVSRENGFHPIRTYLGSLVHDGVPRLDTWLIRHLGAEDNPYIRKIGRLFLISMVARVMRPGAKVDYMLVLEGSQGEGKSTACRILAGERYFRDNLPDISNKDAAIALVGMWLVEFAELEGFGKKDATEIKAFLTRQSDKYRPPYGRNEVVSKRQNVFIGSTNSDTYLKDATGGRRFWPVKCGALDLPGLQRNRDQLFAEAYLAFLDCEAWWPEREFAAEHIVTEQAARYECDPWEDPIRRFLSNLEGDRVSSADILNQVVSLPIAQRNQQATRRVTDILRRLGWDRWRSNGNNLWRRPTVSSRPNRRA